MSGVSQVSQPVVEMIRRLNERDNVTVKTDEGSSLYIMTESYYGEVTFGKSPPRIFISWVAAKGKNHYSTSLPWMTEKEKELFVEAVKSFAASDKEKSKQDARKEWCKRLGVQQ